ncbi:hypothetical protein BDV06DRAFT_193813 [Aspergillus oleicola]
MAQSFQVVFALRGSAEAEPCIFKNDHGPLALKAHRKRGRPKGSKPRGKARRTQADDAGSNNFDFVNYTGSLKTDSSTQKVIRRRGMLLHLREKRQDMLEDRHSKALVPQPSGVDPFDAAPLKIEPYMHDLLRYCCTSTWKYFYMIEEKAGINPIQEFWMPLAFQDSALLHAFIAFSAHFAPEIPSTDRQPLVLHHLAQAISQANNRMAPIADGVSVETIVIIALAAIIQNSHGTKAHWEHSMQGLRALISYDGVLETLEQKPLVLGAIYRADLSGSLDVVQRPFLSKHLAWPQKPSDLPLRDGFAQLEQTLILHQRVRYSLQRLGDTVESLRRLLLRDLVDAANCRFVFTACQYDLLSFECEDAPNETCRLSLIIYTLAVVDERPHNEAAYDGLLSKFQALWCQIDHELLPQFKLWSMFIAIPIARRPTISSWCVQEASALLINLGIFTLNGFCAMMEKFLPICSARAQEVWNRCAVTSQLLLPET